MVYISNGRKKRRNVAAGVSMTALMGLGALFPQGADYSALAAQSAKQPVNADQITTESPIKHVIIIVGENRSFDNIYGTYQPKAGETVSNILSLGIVNADGTPGPNFAKGRQFQATSNNGHFSLNPSPKTPYTFLPVPTILNADPVGVGLEFGIVTASGMPTKNFPQGDPDIPLNDQIQLATGGTTQTSGNMPIPPNGTDTRIPGAMQLPSGPFPQSGPTLPYDSYEGDTIHQHFQMWQQNDCSMNHATPDNPTGCLHDLYPFVAVTYNTLPGQTSTDGSQDMAFYNMLTGDAPVFKSLAAQYTLSDNFHQSINGGSVTGALAIGFGDDAFFTDGNGNLAVPTGSIMNPDPVPGTVNTYQSVGTWVKCSDPSQPGVAEIQSYLKSLPYFVTPNCVPNAYYATRDAEQPYKANGSLAPVDPTTMPPLTQAHIGDLLNKKGISWAWYSGGYDGAVLVANGATDIVDLITGAGYCDECNPFSYAKDIMADEAQRTAHLKDVTDNLFDDITSGNLPAVAFVKPDGALQGHPGTGKVDLFEDFIQDIVTRVQANPQLWAETAIIVEEDETGGLYDSGFIQPLDFFGDGPRMPMLVISPYSTGGHVVHTYYDQASVLKFIERNWRIDGTITNRSRDNLPNPVMDKKHPYVPVNMPAIGDLFDMFNFNNATQ